jgi:hypothetical protein
MAAGLIDLQSEREFSMTTNALESINGHRNEATPRRNSFCTSILRISKMFCHSIDSFSCSVRYHFNNATRRALLQMRIIDEAEMLRQKLYYYTDARARRCDCGATGYFLCLFNTGIPYCHLLHAGLPRLVMPEPFVLQQDPG